MKPESLTLQELFESSVRYVVPIFQRTYVWKEEEQWEPLWQDIMAVCELVDTSTDQDSISPHFLGAIVLQNTSSGPKFIAAREIIDGQQRLTTLQLLLDAVQEVVEQYGYSDDSEALEQLVLNKIKVHKESDRFKVWPTLNDQGAFLQVMDNDTTVEKEHKSSQIVKAHEFFKKKTLEYAFPESSADGGEDSGKDDGGVGEDIGEADVSLLAKERLQTLSIVLCSYLKLVAISLDPEDDAQIIFETLNARGTPLLASDLIKNFLFQQAVNDNGYRVSLYNQYWKNFDDEWWQQKTGAASHKAARIENYTHYWLITRRKKEILKDRLFGEFKKYYIESNKSLEDFLEDFRKDSTIYQQAENNTIGGYPQIFWDRIVNVLKLNVVIPVFLWAIAQPEETLSASQRNKFLKVIENWLMYRKVCGFPMSGLNKEIVIILQKVSHNPEKAGDIAEEHLASNASESNLWPTETMVRDALTTTQVYRKFNNALVRCLLEAIENKRRGFFPETSLTGNVGEGRSEQRCPKKCHIEHIMPQSWEKNWTKPDSPYDIEMRERNLHTLGNLTLLGAKLNGQASNNAWVYPGENHSSNNGAQNTGANDKTVGKRELFRQNSVILMTVDVVDNNPVTWNDAKIEQRNTKMIDEFLKIWSRPDTPLNTQGKKKQPVSRTFTKPTETVRKELEEFIYSDNFPEKYKFQNVALEYLTNPQVTPKTITELGYAANTGEAYNLLAFLKTIFEGKPVGGETMEGQLSRTVKNQFLKTDDNLPPSEHLSPEARNHLENIINSINAT